MTVEGTFFIVPNSTFTLEGCAATTRESIRVALANVHSLSGAISLKDTDELVQVWYTSAQCNNWVSHRWADHPEFFGSRGIPQFLPAHLLEGLNEGDSIEFQWVGGPMIVITAAQLRHRYAWAGRFEDALSRVLGK